jgi:hypothetical protein
LNRPAQQQRKSGARFALLLLERGDVGFLPGHIRTLLREFERYGDAGIDSRFGDLQHALRVLKIAPRDADTVAQGEQLEIGRGDAGDHSERHGLAVVPARTQRRFRRGQAGAIATPEVDFIGSAEIGAERLIVRSAVAERT